MLTINLKAAADVLKTSKSAVRKEVYRLRKRYHQLLREVIEETVSSQDDVEKELMELRQGFL